MPSGEIHYAAYKKGYWLAIPASISILFVDWRVALGMISGYTFHRWCDPDWDLMGASSSEGRMVRELPVIGHLLFGISSSYGSLHRRYHRKFLTHFPGVSTAIRMVFALFPLFLLLDYFGVNLYTVYMWKLLLGFWIGLSSADTIHYALDILLGD